MEKSIQFTVRITVYYILCVAGTAEETNRVGFRQGFLALKIVDILTEEATPTSVIHELNRIDNFRFLIQMLASFQRSARKSERKEDANYDNDVINFRDSIINSSEFGCSYLGDITREELNIYSSHLKTESNSVISRIIRAVHHLDLRRIPSFDEAERSGRATKRSEKWIKRDVCNHLFCSPEPTHKQKLIIDELWDYEGKFLVLSGDRWMGLKIPWRLRLIKKKRTTTLVNLLTTHGIRRNSSIK